MHDLPAPGLVARATAWLGGAVFVVSLAAALFTFAFRMEPASDGAAATTGPGQAPSTSSGRSAARAAAVDVLLFTAFALHHSVFARTSVKRRVLRVIGARLERSLYVWVASLLLLGVLFWWEALPGRAYRHQGWAAVPHWLVVAAGAWLTARAAGIIDPLQLAGIRQVIGGGRDDRFQVVGPYHLVRHPIYLGWILMVFGIPDMTWTRFAFAAVSSAYLAAAIPFEERSLVEALGREYVEYQRTVRWRVVPGLW
jgi:protein-S-isoprenylcysteine O-methyltransferase Ste14